MLRECLQLLDHVDLAKGSELEGDSKLMEEVRAKSWRNQPWDENNGPRETGMSGAEPGRGSSELTWFQGRKRTLGLIPIREEAWVHGQAHQPDPSSFPHFLWDSTPKPPCLSQSNSQSPTLAYKTSRDPLASSPDFLLPLSLYTCCSLHLTCCSLHLEHYSQICTWLAPSLPSDS